MLQYPLGSEIKYSVGKILQVKSEAGTLLHNANTASGSSGAPLLNVACEIVGMHQGGYKHEGYNQAIIMKTITDAFTDLNSTLTVPISRAREIS